MLMTSLSLWTMALKVGYVNVQLHCTYSKSLADMLTENVVLVYIMYTAIHLPLSKFTCTMFLWSEVI